MPGAGIIERDGVRVMIRLQENDTKLYVSWFFTLPPEVDRSQPVRFSTTFSINGLPALPVRVVIPPIAWRNPPTSRTAATTRAESVSIPARHE
jgi:hypothetical protein